MSKSVVLNYLKENFSNLSLESPLFYNADIGIRFELGIPYRKIECPNYFNNVLIRAAMLFKEVFDEDDNLMLVVKRFQSIEPYKIFNEGIDLFDKYIRTKEIVERINCIELEKNYEDNGDLSGINYQYELICRKEDINYKGIIEAKSHQDFAIDPYISDAVFFINIDKHIIFYMYDDRGLDIVSKDKESLKNIYKKYNDWILEYDRNRIDSIFNS